MSRVARAPIPIPSQVKVEIQDQLITFTGQKGKLSYLIPEYLTVNCDSNVLQVGVLKQSRDLQCLAGTTRAHLSNQVRGVSEGFSVKLNLQGIGYSAKVEENVLMLKVGYSDIKRYIIPEGIQVEMVNPTEILIKGIDTQKVHQVAEEIIRIRPPNAYRAAGILGPKPIKLKVVKKK